MAAEASRDLKGWVQRSFTLTPVQQQRLNAMSPQTIQEIKHAIEPIARQGGSIKISVTERQARDDASARAAASAQKAKESKEKEQKGMRLATIFDGTAGGHEAAKKQGQQSRRVSFTLADPTVQPARPSGTVQKQLAPAPR